MVGDAQLPVERHHLRLEPQRGDLRPVVLDDVVAHRRDAIRGLHDLIDPRGSLGDDAGLALVEALGFGQLGEGLVERVVVDVEVDETGLDVDRERRPVGDRPLHRVVVQHAVGIVRVAEGRPRVPVVGRDRRAGQTDELGAGQRLTHVEPETALLGAVRFVDHHHDVRSVVE